MQASSGGVVRSFTSGRPNACQAAVPPSSTAHLGALAQRLQPRPPRAAPAPRPARSTTTCRAPASCGPSAPSRRAHAPQRAGDVAVAVVDAARDRSTTTVLSPLSSSATSPARRSCGTGAASSGTGRRPTSGAADARPGRPRPRTRRGGPSGAATRAAMRARTPVSSSSTMRALRTPIHCVGRLHQLAARRVAAARTVAGAELRRIAHVEHVRACGPDRPRSGRDRAAPITPTPDASAKAWRGAAPAAAVFGVPGGKRSVRPRSQRQPASSQPIVPLRSATTLLGMPARRRLSAPMMLRVRPAQFTTTSVFGSGARSPMR